MEKINFDNKRYKKNLSTWSMMAKYEWMHNKSQKYIFFNIYVIVISKNMGYFIFLLLSIYIGKIFFPLIRYWSGSNWKLLYSKTIWNSC